MFTCTAIYYLLRQSCLSLGCAFASPVALVLVLVLVLGRAGPSRCMNILLSRFFACCCSVSDLTRLPQAARLSAFKLILTDTSHTAHQLRQWRFCVAVTRVYSQRVCTLEQTLLLGSFLMPITFHAQLSPQTHKVYIHMQV